MKKVILMFIMAASAVFTATAQENKKERLWYY
jgi:hypothetical protein